MDILLSWSGNASHEVALFLRDWLPEVLPGCKPWVSSEDIQKGKPWWDELHSFLGGAKVSVIIVTPENVRSPWVFYEAGIIAAKLDRAYVCPYLVGVAGKLIQGTPLGGYQWTEADKTDTLKLIRTLHSALGSPHDTGMLEGNFKSRWPQLKTKLERVIEGLGDVEDPVTQTEPPLVERLSEEAKQMLIMACQSPRAVIYHNRGLEGVLIRAGTQTMNVPNDSRSTALWKGASDELLQLKLIEQVPNKHDLFEVSRSGWELYDQLKPNRVGP